MTVGFITYYRRLTQKLIKNPNLLTIIIKTMQQLEGLQFATRLDINMGYYTTKLSTANQKMTIIVTKFGKSRYNRLSMGMCTSGDILQTKVD